MQQPDAETRMPTLPPPQTEHVPTYSMFMSWAPSKAVQVARHENRRLSAFLNSSSGTVWAPWFAVIEYVFDGHDVLHSFDRYFEAVEFEVRPQQGGIRNCGIEQLLHGGRALLRNELFQKVRTHWVT
jgi:hypothetical protein